MEKQTPATMNGWTSSTGRKRAVVVGFALSTGYRFPERMVCERRIRDWWVLLNGDLQVDVGRVGVFAL